MIAPVVPDANYHECQKQESREGHRQWQEVQRGKEGYHQTEKQGDSYYEPHKYDLGVILLFRTFTRHSSLLPRERLVSASHRIPGSTR